MKNSYKISVGVLVLSFLGNCNNNHNRSDINVNVSTYLDSVAQKKLLAKICRYAAKRPKNVSCGKQFDSQFDAYYQEELKKYRWEGIYPASNKKEYFFLVSRSAPSLYEKRVAIGGKIALDEKDSIIYYEEAFRLYKMKIEEMKRKSQMVFQEYIEGKDLTRYYPQNSSEEIIEFPDQTNYFNVSTGCWEQKH
ncbi:MAG: hypothetical protein NZM38_03015 [Cytophagales bacterium]|nr:hypothetical protein [Cytophagales bacterium]MDW8383724.1 hypothetical protein [Flammeovirgaceae bacterium]